MYFLRFVTVLDVESGFVTERVLYICDKNDVIDLVIQDT